MVVSPNVASTGSGSLVITGMFPVIVVSGQMATQDGIVLESSDHWAQFSE